MKILVVCQHFYPENFRINDICYELVKRGNEVTVLTGLPNYPKGKVLKEYKWFKNRNQVINGVKIKRCSLVGRGSNKIRMIINYLWFAIFGSLKALFTKKDFDVVYVYQLSPITMTWPAIVVKKIKKIPLVIHVLDQWPVSITTGGVNKSSIIYKIVSNLSINTYNYADLITCSSKSFKNYFINELGLSKDKKFIYLPSYAENDYANIKSNKNNIFDVVFAGNIGPAQSVETIVEAANILKDNKNIYFHIIGDGLNRKNCEELVNKYNLNNIKFYGYFDVSKMPKFYTLADAFLITMVDNEVVNSTLPAKIQSYMLAAKPIIGAINGEVKDVIKEAKCGLCCNSLDYKEFANLILKASKSTKLEEWSKNSYNYYLEHFEKEKCIDELEMKLQNTIKVGKINDYSSILEKFIKFGIIGGISMFIDLLLFNIFYKYFFTNIVIISTIVARILSSLFNYFCNKNISFSSKSNKSLIKYYILCVLQMMASALLVKYVYPICNFNIVFVKFLVDVVLFIISFNIQRLWVFRKDDE